MSTRISKYCAPSRWELVAREEAMAAALDPVRLLSGACRRRPYVYARWRAWRRLKAMGHSYKSIADASGFDHSTVMYGIKRDLRTISENAPCTEDVRICPVVLASAEIGVIGNRPIGMEAIE